MQNRVATVMLLLAGCNLGPDTSAIEQRLSIEPTTGIGFVGKGRVQSLFHWNNEGLQTNVGALAFRFELHAQYAQSCIHTTGGMKVVHKTFEKSFDLESAVDWDARRNPQVKVTGFLLNGFTGDERPPTDLCNPGQSEPDDIWLPDPNGLYPVLTQTSATDPGTLYVSFGDESHALWSVGDPVDDEAMD